MSSYRKYLKSDKKQYSRHSDFIPDVPPKPSGNKQKIRFNPFWWLLLFCRLAGICFVWWAALIVLTKAKGLGPDHAFIGYIYKLIVVFIGIAGSIAVWNAIRE